MTYNEIYKILSFEFFFDYNRIIVSTQNNVIIITSSAKQRGAQMYNAQVGYGQIGRRPWWVCRSWVGGWLGRHLLFLITTFLLIKNWVFFKLNFFGHPIFLFDLTNQKDHLMVNERNHQSSWMCLNQLVQYDQVVKLTKCQNGWFLIQFFSQINCDFLQCK